MSSIFVRQGELTDLHVFLMKSNLKLTYRFRFLLLQTSCEGQFCLNLCCVGWLIDCLQFCITFNIMRSQLASRIDLVLTIANIVAQELLTL